MIGQNVLEAALEADRVMRRATGRGLTHMCFRRNSIWHYELALMGLNSIMQFGENVKVDFNELRWGLKGVMQ